MRSYSHDNSPKVFTQLQLLACLILKAYLGTTYRGLIDQLALMPAVREAIGLKRLPHFTALQKFGSSSSVLRLAAERLPVLVLSQFHVQHVEQARIVAYCASGARETPQPCENTGGSHEHDRLENAPNRHPPRRSI